MLTTYRLFVSLLFVVAMAAPRLRSDVRIMLAIAFVSGLVLVWHSGRADVIRGDATRGVDMMSWTVVVPVSLLLAGAVFVAVWRILDSAASSGL